VNKVNSKAILKWSLKKTDALPESVMRRFRLKYSKRISNDNEFVISSHRFRDQGRNVADCLSKLRDLILAVADEPKPRKKTKTSKAAKRRRLDNKKRKSLTKQARKPPRHDDH